MTELSELEQLRAEVRELREEVRRLQPERHAAGAKTVPRGAGCWRWRPVERWAPPWRSGAGGCGDGDPLIAGIVFNTVGARPVSPSRGSAAGYGIGVTDNGLGDFPASAARTVRSRPERELLDRRPRLVDPVGRHAVSARNDASGAAAEICDFTATASLRGRGHEGAEWPPTVAQATACMEGAAPRGRACTALQSTEPTQRSGPTRKPVVPARASRRPPSPGAGSSPRARRPRCNSSPASRHHIRPGVRPGICSSTRPAGCGSARRAGRRRPGSEHGVDGDSDQVRGEGTRWTSDRSSSSSGRRCGSCVRRCADCAERLRVGGPTGPRGAECWRWPPAPHGGVLPHLGDPARPTRRAATPSSWDRATRSAPRRVSR